MTGAGFPVVGVGASAGGLEAFRNLLAALPADSGMAFILVQHLDPHHDSMLADLLARHTAMRVRQAAARMEIAPDNLYIIPPGADLAVQDGFLHLTAPAQRHGARLPFDHLLRSLAEGYGPRAACVILSGTGNDGCAGARAIRDHGGRVIAQDPKEAGHDGMPRSAIAAGVVDQILPIAQIPAALARLSTHPLPPDPPEEPMRPDQVPARPEPAPDAAPQDAPAWLADVIGFLRARTSHDFTLYKPGTLQRRIERRMALAAMNPAEPGRYLARLDHDEQEVGLLVRDLLINVTSFFRDASVFDFLEGATIPALVEGATDGASLRLWTAGCSTGEETYSLAMLFLERIEAAGRPIKLQVFASDIDAEAVAIAREGRYPAIVAEQLGAERIARFFTEEDGCYRVRPELRACIVFTVQDLLTDPPFSRLDMVSCRNLLIYLQPAAQAKAFSLFGFALRKGGILMLGRSETIGAGDTRFEPLSKTERIYRRVDRNRPGDIDWAIGIDAGGRGAGQPATARTPALAGARRPPDNAELCRRAVLETHAPAAVLIDRDNEVLYTLGPIERYLRITAGHPSHDILALTPPGLRNRLRSGLAQIAKSGSRTAIAGGTTTVDGRKIGFRVDIEPVSHDSETLFLLCFIDEAPAPTSPTGRSSDRPATEIAHELAATRAELHEALHKLERATQDQKAIHEEALSANEEFQSTTEELLTSKEELQSLNEELTALNSQLQETLERQRVTANDLQNVLNSTNVATLFLDRALDIRMFTPATRALFTLIPTDIGRRLADLRSLAADDALLTDAAHVLDGNDPIDRQIEVAGGTWFVRRILPYLTRDGQIEGVVITFNDITERHRATAALDAAKRQAEHANQAKSRFLAAASHDLRQPLQSLVLIHGLLSRQGKDGLWGEKQQELLRRQGQTLEAMSGMLNTLLDINQIEAGIVAVSPVDVPLGDLLARLGQEYAFQASARNLGLRVLPCRHRVHSDPRLLEQIIRNLLSNALKYTRQGKILLGWRRRGVLLTIEVWDTGIGIAESELGAIFDEYHQIGNSAREAFRGLGLGLSIVRGLAGLLHHKLAVRSWPGKGSVFTIEVPIADPGQASARASRPAAKPRKGAILLIEDDPEIRDLLDLFLTDAGHQTAAAADGAAARDLIDTGRIRPDLILTDYNLPGALNGLQLVALLRSDWQYRVPAIVLTGDIATGSPPDGVAQDIVVITKPVDLTALSQVIQTSLADARRPLARAAGGIVVIDADDAALDLLREALENAGHAVTGYPSAEAFLQAHQRDSCLCLLLDAHLPGMSGIDLLGHLKTATPRLPVIVMTGGGDVAMAIDAMRSGAVEFIEKPIAIETALTAVERALRQSGDAAGQAAIRQDAIERIGRLTQRQREIMDLVLAGKPTKTIATTLGLSQRTVDAHRAAIMARTRATSLPDLARLAMAAERESKP